MAYWLMKSEPDVFGIDDLAKSPGKTTHWDGVRNFQARSFMRDQMSRGDLAFFYHSNCDEPGDRGHREDRQGRVSRSHCVRRQEDTHFDADSDPAKPRWYMVDVQLQRKFRRRSRSRRCANTATAR